MFSPEAELEKEQARLEGAVVEAARAFITVWRELDAPMTDDQGVAWMERVSDARSKLDGAVGALERHLGGESG